MDSKAKEGNGIYIFFIIEVKDFDLSKNKDKTKYYRHKTKYYQRLYLTKTHTKFLEKKDKFKICKRDRRSKSD